jgi:hypothetical protein
MTTRVMWRLAPGLGFAAGLLVGWAALATVAAPTRDAVVAWASTNLANLPDHPVGALVLSAFVTESNPVGWVLMGLVGLTATAWRFGAWRTVLLVTTAHVVGTLVSEGILAYRIWVGLAPASDRFIVDIGASYVVVCALVAGIAYGTWPGRVLCAIGFVLLAPDLFAGVEHLDVAPVGHVCSIVIALGLGWPMWRAATRRDGARRAAARRVGSPEQATSIVA